MGVSDEQLSVRVAWLYYMEGLTQDRIGARLGITRLRVNRLLAEAREQGLVSIAINSRSTAACAWRRRCAQGAGLADAVIVPTPDDPAQLPACSAGRSPNTWRAT